LLYRLSYRPTYMRRARESVLFSIARNSEGILPNTRSVFKRADYPW